MTSPNPFPSPPSTPGEVFPITATPLPGSFGLATGAGLAEEPTGTIARTIPRALVNSATLAALNINGTIAARAIALPKGVSVANISILTGSTPANGPTHLWFALADLNLNVLAVTADATGNTQAAAAFITLAFAAKFVTTYSGLYYILVSSSATVTAPTLCGPGVSAAGNSAGPPVLCGTAGVQVAPPAVNTQVNAGTVTSNGSMNYAAWIS